ncbi:ATP-binding cassette domain-containing protein [Amycolatopsis sp. NPDC059090]|uniref:ATP-binding cassette domain-containing protein n=1 Tax=unclassified Amycolatopsis TaxID=2618356 RepID=UPI00366C8287
MTPLLSVEALTVAYRTGRRTPPLVAVDSVDLEVPAGKTVGIVGESGSGKSSLGAAVLGLVRPASGTVRFDGRDITAVSAKQRRELAGEVQVVFQDPYGSLNPVKTVGQTLAEPLRLVLGRSRAEAKQTVRTALERVGLPPEAAGRYPAQFSGGQRQRIAIARALVMSPRLIVCDEPVSALDLSVQAQVLNLLRDLQDELGVSYLFISHDLAVVRHVCHDLVVMRSGEVVERGPTEQIYRDPRHEYTRALLDAVPRRRPRDVPTTGPAQHDAGRNNDRSDPRPTRSAS